MKNVKFLTIAIMFAIIGSMATYDLSAQGGGRGKGKHNGKKQANCENFESRDSMRQAKHTEMQAKLLVLKNNFDAKLSSADLAKLDELRSQATTLRGDAPNFKRNDNKGKMNAEKREEMREIRKEHRELMQPILAELKLISDKYRDDVQSLNAELEALRSANRNGECGERMGRKGKGMKQGKRNCDSSCTKDSAMFNKKSIKAVRFLLWDGSPMPINEKATPKVNSEGKLGNYPNPFNEQTTISFYLPSNDLVTIDLFDNSGNKLGQIFKGNLNSGKNEVVFSASSIEALMPGILVYQINANNFNRSGKMIYKK